MMPIVVRSVGSGESKVDEEDEGRQYYHVDFTMVDLDTGKVCHEFRPSMYSCMGLGNMVKLGDPATLYVIGGARHPNAMSEKLLKLKEEKQPGYYMGACRASGLNGDWQHIDLPNEKANYCLLPGCVAAMMGRIYCFGYPGLRPEVYDPMFEKWDYLSTASLPEELLKSPPDVSLPVVPDPQNNRILLHLSGGYLYAFYPSEEGGGGDWVCLSKEFHHWYEVAAVVDNVLYFHEFGIPSVLRAYDLTTGEWLDVVWSTLEIDCVFLSYREFSALFSVGKGVLCLAHSGATLGQRDCPLNFFKIAVQRTSPSALHLTPLSLKSFTIPSTEVVLDFVPLKVSMWFGATRGGFGGSSHL